MTRPVTRLAPTPSGFLHAGNAVNLLLVSWLASHHDAELVLRIDDVDATRYRPQYVDDVFTVLDWLGISWQRGPTSRADFESNHSMRDRTAYYRAELDVAVTRGLDVFACRCTRSEILAAAAPGCVRGCRDLALDLATHQTSLRATHPSGEVVLWRRDGLPAYHLASIIEDRDIGTTHVVRGEDLRAATQVQVHLAPYLGASVFARATFVHHALVLDADGTKLSKSNAAQGPMTRDAHQRDAVTTLARAMAGPLGLAAPG